MCEQKLQYASMILFLACQARRDRRDSVHYITTKGTRHVVTMTDEDEVGRVRSLLISRGKLQVTINNVHARFSPHVSNTDDRVCTW